MLVTYHCCFIDGSFDNIVHTISRNVAHYYQKSIKYATLNERDYSSANPLISHTERQLSIYNIKEKHCFDK